VLIHPLTDTSYDDHTKYAIWLGRPVALRSSIQARPGKGLYKL
jgi:aromatic ring-cleaving dioxygenase